MKMTKKKKTAPKNKATTKKTRIGSRSDDIFPISDAQIAVLMETFSAHVNYVYSKKKEAAKLKETFVDQSLGTIYTILCDAQRASLLKFVAEKF